MNNDEVEMIISEREYKLLKEVEDITTTDYNVRENNMPKYYVSNYSLLSIIFDLKVEYDHLLEKYEELKNERR